MSESHNNLPYSFTSFFNLCIETFYISLFSNKLTFWLTIQPSVIWTYKTWRYRHVYAPQTVFLVSGVSLRITFYLWACSLDFAAGQSFRDNKQHNSFQWLWLVGSLLGWHDFINTSSHSSPFCYFSVWLMVSLWMKGALQVASYHLSHALTTSSCLFK